MLSDLPEGAARHPSHGTPGIDNRYLFVRLPAQLKSDTGAHDAGAEDDHIGVHKVGICRAHR